MNLEGTQTLGLIIGKLISQNEHISKSPGRKCRTCNQKIIWGDTCISQTYLLVNNPKKLGVSYHVNCFNNTEKWS